MGGGSGGRNSQLFLAAAGGSASGVNDVHRDLDPTTALLQFEGDVDFVPSVSELEVAPAGVGEQNYAVPAAGSAAVTRSTASTGNLGTVGSSLLPAKPGGPSNSLRRPSSTTVLALGQSTALQPAERAAAITQASIPIFPPNPTYPRLVFFLTWASAALSAALLSLSMIEITRLTSAVTLMVLGQARNCLTVLLAVLLFSQQQESWSSGALVGSGILLFGVVWYMWARNREENAAVDGDAEGYDQIHAVHGGPGNLKFSRTSLSAGGGGGSTGICGGKSVISKWCGKRRGSKRI